MKIEYRDGLIFTSVKVIYKNSSKIIDNVVIDLKELNISARNKNCKL